MQTKKLLPTEAVRASYPVIVLNIYLSCLQLDQD